MTLDRRSLQLLAGAVLVLLALATAASLEPVEVVVADGSERYRATCGLEYFLAGADVPAVEAACRDKFRSHAVGALLALALLGVAVAVVLRRPWDRSRPILPTQRRHWLAAGVLLLAFLPSLETDASYRSNDAVDITSPTNRASVQVPFELSWESARSGRYAVFVDRLPVAPGEGLDTGTPLVDQHVYVTSERTLTIDRVPPRRRSGEAHEATIVELDEQGRRVGESAWSVRFFTGGNG